MIANEHEEPARTDDRAVTTDDGSSTGQPVYTTKQAHPRPSEPSNGGSTSDSGVATVSDESGIDNDSGAAKQTVNGSKKLWRERKPSYLTTAKKIVRLGRGKRVLLELSTGL